MFLCIKNKHLSIRLIFRQIEEACENKEKKWDMAELSAELSTGDGDRKILVWPFVSVQALWESGIERI